MFGAYISREGEAKLHEYKYSGSDASLIFKYLVSPLSAYIVNYLPKTLAPNVITLFAFFLVVLSHILVVGMDGGGWRYVVSGCIYFCYLVLDSMDGKQARRIGASSPVGLLLDHGCDALVTVMMTLNLQVVLAFNAEVQLSWICLTFAVPIVTFFFATWEELFVGTLDLPIVGVNEATFFMIAVHFYQAVHPGFMTENSGIFDLPLNQLVTCGFLVLAIIVIGNGIANVARLNKERSIWNALSTTIPFLLTIVIGLGWTLISADHISKTRLSLHSVLWLVGICFSKLVTHMQIAHISKDKFAPWRKTLFVPIVLFTGNHFLHAVDDSLCLALSLSVAFISWAHLVFCTFSQMLRILNLSFLTVAPKPKSK